MFSEDLRSAAAPKVSVCVMTYNQAGYIGQCLQSLVDQQTDFPFEIIVGDDGSTDGTREVIQDFVARHPGLIVPVLHERNIGPTVNYFSVHNLARGVYVAHLDGDDYALPGKLQKLSDHLDGHPDCAIVWHRMQILNEKSQFAVGMPVVPVSRTYGAEKLYAQDLALYYGLTGCHSGSMYRRECKRLSSFDGNIVDYHITLSLCIDGKCAMYIEEPYGVYRFIAGDKTLTKVKGAVYTGRGKLRLMKDFMGASAGVRKSFAAQCVFELMLRTYFGHPLKKEFLRVLLDCGCLPAPSDVLKIVNIFLSNRNGRLRASFQ
jgi:glycosyltransferase involved in cell wall biosynthesis